MVRGWLIWVFGLAGPVFSQINVTDPLYYRDNHERFSSYLNRTYTDPARLGWLLVDSATDTWSKSPHQWDQSAESYSYRVASGWGRRIVRNTLQLGFETALHEDSRYRPSNQHGLGRRFVFAVSRSVLAHKPDGSVEPAYGRIAAGVASAAISSTWHPQSTRGDALLCGAAQAVLDRAGSNLLAEFQPDLKSVGKKTWNRVFGR